MFLSNLIQLCLTLESVCVCHTMKSPRCELGPHVEPIRTNQKAVIRVGHGEVGGVPLGTFYDS